MTVTTARRRTKVSNPRSSDGDDAVRDLLREIAYVLHVTRKIGHRGPRPAAAGGRFEERNTWETSSVCAGATS